MKRDRLYGVTGRPDFTPFRFELVAQEAPRAQASLFELEPRTEPPCEHPEAQWQRTIIAGREDRTCVQCGAVVSWRRIEIHEGPDNLGRYFYTLLGPATYHPGDPRGEHRLAERGRVFFATLPEWVTASQA